MAQTCTRSLARMMQTSSRDGIHASKVYQHQQHAAPPARTRRSEMHEGTHSSRTAHAIEPGPKMQTRPDLDRVCILGPEHRQRPSAAQRVPSIAIVKLDQKVHRSVALLPRSLSEKKILHEPDRAPAGPPRLRRHRTVLTYHACCPRRHAAD